MIAAIVGAPGSGKSTFAEWLADELNAQKHGRAAVLPMDGYHYDDQLLKQMGRLKFKGASDTFDVHGLRHMLFRLRENKEDEVAVPVFDREIEIARSGARLISRSTEIILVEGNYLLLNDRPWNSLREFFDITVFLKVDEEVLLARLRNRWEKLGLDEDAIQHKLNNNDMPNGRFVSENSRAADFVVQSAL